MPYLGTAPASELANLDINGQSLILDADADTHITADTDDQIDIHIAGADDFQFTANTFTAQSGSTIAAQALTATSIGTGDGSAGSPSYTFTSDTDTGMFWVSAGIIGWSSQGTEEMRLNSQHLFLSETANTGAAGGAITINQQHNDDEILALKSSDIAHGLTSVAETDTYGSLRKNDGGIRGGLAIYGMAESDYTGAGVELHAYSQGVDSASSTSATSVVSVRASKTSGTGGAALSSNANAFQIVASGNTQWICDAEGDTKYNGSDGAGAFDDWDDVELLTTARHVTVTDKKFAKKMFGNFVQENAEVLDKYGVITMNDDGNHFISTKGLNALVIDAIRQTRNIQKAFYNILSDEQKNKFAGELNEMKLPVLPAFQTP